VFLIDVAILKHHSNVLFQISNVSNILVTLNSSVNFFIYCICSRDFRSVLYRMFYCGRCRRRRRKLPHAPKPVVWHNHRQQQRFGTVAAPCHGPCGVPASRPPVLRPVLLQQVDCGRVDRRSSQRPELGAVLRAAAHNATALNNMATLEAGGATIAFWPNKARCAGTRRASAVASINADRAMR